MSFERARGSAVGRYDMGGAPRRLVAILSADVCGYSRLIEQDEDRTRLELTEARQIVQDEVSSLGGRIVDAVGDNVLAEFVSAVNAVLAAMSIQERLSEPADNAESPLQLRIGITIGDVVVDGASIIGPGVNIAARVQGLAEPGGIAVAANVVEQVSHKVPAAFRYVGKFHLKNITAVVGVYAVAPIGERPRRWLAPQSRWARFIAAGVVASIALVALMVLAIHVHEVLGAFGLE